MLNQQEQLSTVDEGNLAVVLIVTGDPTINIHSSLKIEAVGRGGHLVYLNEVVRLVLAK